MATKPPAGPGAELADRESSELATGDKQLVWQGEEGLGPDTRQPDPARSLLGAPDVPAMHPSHGDAWTERQRSAG
ncbi:MULTISPECIES: hypothetical protein [Streptomyces]|uniref:hypothetical protein n=1 Tax=Streptomyces TaxID=1883 RepID=UPI003418232D